MTDSLPVIALTMGDPAGIGPEVVLKALADPEVAPLAHWVVVGDRRILSLAERFTGVSLGNVQLHDTGALALIRASSSSAASTPAAAPRRSSTSGSPPSSAWQARRTRWLRRP